MKCKSDMQKRKQDCLLMKARISLPLMAGSLLLFCFSNRSYSQGNISMEQVDIVKAYQPLLADAEKIVFKAEPVVADSSITELKYDVKPHLISVPFVPAEIRAVALPVQEIEPLQNNLLKAGFGMQLTPLLELNLHNGHSDKFSYGANFHHLSSNGSKIDYQDFSHTGGDLFGTAYVGGSSLSASAGYDHRKNYFYADTLSDTINNPKKTLKRTYNYLPVELTFQNTRNAKENLNYRFNFKYHHFDGMANATFLLPEKEDYFNFNLLLQKEIKKIHTANLSFAFENMQNKLVGQLDTSQTALAITPYYGLQWKNLQLKAGLSIGIFDKEVSFFPTVHAEYKLIGEYLIPYIGWEGGWQPATMHYLTTINPYLGNTLTSYSKINEGYAGMKGSYGNNISYNVKGGIRTQTNLPMYMPEVQNPAYYKVEYYYKVNIINVHAEVVFRQSERINLILSGETNAYDMDFDDQPLGIPKSTLMASLNYNIQNKIITQVDFFANSGAYTKTGTDSMSTQLNGRADANISVSYDYKRNIAFWLSLNNIFGANNSLWYNYPTYGFQAMAGVKLKF